MYYFSPYLARTYLCVGVHVSPNVTVSVGCSRCNTTPNSIISSRISKGQDELGPRCVAHFLVFTHIAAASIEKNFPPLVYTRFLWDCLCSSWISEPISAIYVILRKVRPFIPLARSHMINSSSHAVVLCLLERDEKPSEFP